MLGRLARWLRALGFDTLYEHGIDDDELLRRCRAEGRVLLTRDTELSRRGRGDVEILFLESESAQKRLREVLDHFGIGISSRRLFSRCTHCNSPVQELSREEVRGRVPPFVFETGKRFTWCPNCDKIFWRGTHKERFLNLINNQES
jgi:uncharacterized protein with PIN domain